MQKITAGVPVIFLIFFFSYLKAQEIKNPASEIHRNSLNTYIGLFEYNFNYERNLSHRSKSYTNVRMGFGKGMFIVAGEGIYLNPSMIEFFGKGNSHLELDLGFKYMVTNSITNPSFFETFIPDIFAGYRYEKPSGSFIFRAGNNYPTLVNVGIGYKF